MNIPENLQPEVEKIESVGIGFKPVALWIEFKNKVLARFGTDPTAKLDIVEMPDGHLEDPKVTLLLHLGEKQMSDDKNPGIFQRIRGEKTVKSKLPNLNDPEDLYRLQSAGFIMHRALSDLRTSAALTIKRTKQSGIQQAAGEIKDKLQKKIEIVEQKLQFLADRIGQLPEQQGSQTHYLGLERAVIAGAALGGVGMQSVALNNETAEVSPVPRFATQELSQGNANSVAIADLEAFFSFDASVPQPVQQDGGTIPATEIPVFPTPGEILPTASPMPDVNLRISPNQDSDSRGTASEVSLTSFTILGKATIPKNNIDETWYYFRTPNVNNGNSLWVNANYVNINGSQDVISNIPDLTNTYNLLSQMPVIDRAGYTVQGVTADQLARIEIANTAFRNLTDYGFPPETFQSGNLALYQPINSEDQNLLFKQLVDISRTDGGYNEVNSIFTIFTDGAQITGLVYLAPTQISGVLASLGHNSAVDIQPMNVSGVISLNDEWALDARKVAKGFSIQDSLIMRSEMPSNAPSVTIWGLRYLNEIPEGQVVVPNYEYGSFSEDQFLLPDRGRFLGEIIVDAKNFGIFQVIYGSCVDTQLPGPPLQWCSFLTSREDGGINAFVYPTFLSQDQQAGHRIFEVDNISVISSINNNQPFSSENIVSSTQWVDGIALNTFFNGVSGRPGFVAIETGTYLYEAFKNGEPLTTGPGRYVDDVTAEVIPIDVLNND